MFFNPRSIITNLGINVPKRLNSGIMLMFCQSVSVCLASSTSSGVTLSVHACVVSLLYYSKKVMCHGL